MSVNLSYGIQTKKTKHLGQYFHSIDFDVNLTTQQFIKFNGENVLVGQLWINGKSQKITLRDLNYVINNEDLTFLQLPEDLTKHERERIFETFYNAKIVFWQKVRLQI